MKLVSIQKLVLVVIGQRLKKLFANIAGYEPQYCIDEAPRRWFGNLGGTPGY